MVCSVYTIKNSGAAAAYYSQTDDYYRAQGHAPTAWAGRGAEALGLRGEVSTEQARELLEGRLPNGERVGGDDHRPGYDVTFSAPKSVSVAAYVYGDTRLLDAHNEAVKAAIDYLEREAACTRIRENGEVRTEATGNLIAAVYRHDTNRESECNLHSHAVVMNVTQSADGRWRSIESKPIYRLQIEAGQVYSAALARACERLGYDIEKTVAGKHPSFELANVTQAERDLHSTRSKQIEAELAKIGKTRETATAEEKQTATLNTRAAKEETDRGALLEKWREQHRQAGFSASIPSARTVPAEEYMQRADEAVKSAVAHLSERETRFTARQIASEARRIGTGKIDDRDIDAAIARAADRGELVARETRQYDVITGQKTEQAGYTTQEAIEIESRMLYLSNSAVGTAQPAMTREQAEEAIRLQETKSGFAFNDAQKEATRTVLTGSDRINLIQGYAGTAKTTSVLAASAAAYRELGYEVVALAPTHSAAKTLGDAIGAESNTVAKFNSTFEKQDDKRPPRVYIIDEASMLSARDMQKLLYRTSDSRDRVIMVGDVKQLGSVEAGAAFRQLQTESRLTTKELDTIVRQRNETLRQAVYDTIKGNAAGALEKVEVRELETREDRVQAIARDYTSLSAEDRQKTIIIAPGRDDRRQINDAVRAELKSRGDLGEARQYEVLDRVDMTREEAKRAASYEVGYRLQAGRDYLSLGMKKGHYATVVEVDINKNRIVIENSVGMRREIDPSKYSALQAHETRQIEIAAGDRIVNRDSNDKLKNGAVLHVEKVTDKQIHARDESGTLHKLDMAKAQKLDHAYAQTGHEAQGRTCDRVLVHGESTRTNLMSQQNAYVAISRAKESATVYTDSREKLAEQIGRETGQKETARSNEQRGPGGKQPEQRDTDEIEKAERRVREAEERLERYERNPGTPGGYSNRAAALDYAKRELDEARHARDRAYTARQDRDAERDRPADKHDKPKPQQQPRPIDTRDYETRQRDAALARAALNTSGRYPQPGKINKDIDRGKARYEYDSRGERYLVYRNKAGEIKKAFHQQLHGRVREVTLRNEKTLGLTTKTAKIVDKKLEIFGIKTRIKIGERVVIGRETALQRQFGRERDELKQRMRDPNRGALSKAWARAVDSVARDMNAEGWRAAGKLESIRASIASMRETSAMRAEAREKLQETIKAAESVKTRGNDGFER